MIETTSLKRLSFPRSLRQLVTLSFVLILLPLLVLARQAAEPERPQRPCGA